ncbi:MAG: ankyrin repeat domain-containing protein [Bdellovibrionales bacterium]|nr:ankyrin repeat domain-containing protein [Bdellovibrionales bacterium]
MVKLSLLLINLYYLTFPVQVYAATTPIKDSQHFIQYRKSQALWGAANCDLAIVKKELESGTEIHKLLVDPDALLKKPFLSNGGSDTILHVAAEFCDDMGLFQYLLKYKELIIKPFMSLDTHDRVASRYAKHGKNLEILKLLVENDPDAHKFHYSADSEEEEGLPLIAHAIEGGNLDFVKYALQFTDLNEWLSSNDTHITVGGVALRAAVKYAPFEIFKYMFSQDMIAVSKAKSPTFNKDELTSVIDSFSVNQAQIHASDKYVKDLTKKINFLVNNGFDPHGSYLEFPKSLFLAQLNNEPSAVLTQIINTTHSASHLNLACEFAVRVESITLLELLFDALKKTGFDINTRRDLLDLAVSIDSLVMVKYLKSKGILPKTFQNLLWRALSAGSQTMAKYIIDNFETNDLPNALSASLLSMIEVHPSFSTYDSKNIIMMAELLLQSGAKINQPKILKAFKFQTLYSAPAERFTDIFDLFIKYGASFDIDGGDVLSNAVSLPRFGDAQSLEEAQKSSVNILRYLILKLPLRFRAQDFNNALVQAASECNFTALGFFHEKQKIGYGVTGERGNMLHVLHKCSEDIEPYVKGFVEEGNDINDASYGQTPLAAAFRYDGADTRNVDLYIKYGATFGVKSVDYNEKHPIESWLYDVNSGSHKAMYVLKLILEEERKVYTTGYITTLLHTINSTFVREEYVKILIENDAVLDGQDNDLNSALMYAVQRKYINLVKSLVDAGADLNLVNIGLNSALHFAVQAKSLEIVKILAENGAHLNLKNKEGKTALAIAIMNGSSDISKYLLEKGAKL